MSQSLANKFVASISYDGRLAPYDIQGSLVHAAMLGRQKILSPKAVQQITKGLNSILRDIKRGKRIPPDEDIHFAIEKELTRRVGDAGARLHTGRSRNDQVVTDLHLYLKDQIQGIQGEIKDFQRALLGLAQKHQTAVMPGFTHLQHAQPILFAHHVLAYAWMVERDKERFQDLFKRVDVLPLGSAALAGTSFPIDRAYAAKKLGFKNISANSIDATASRDVVVEFLAHASLLMTHLSRLAEELILWSSSEFSFVKLAKAYTTGSSIMPQKRNPDMAELVRGKTGRVYGSLVALLTLLKGTPLAYNRDLQEDKPPLFDAVDTVRGCLGIMSPMLKTMKVNTKLMKQACSEGFLEATEMADYLTKKGVPFRLAHGVVQKVTLFAEQEGKQLKDLSLSDLNRFHPDLDKGVKSVLDPVKAVAAKKSFGGTSPQSVRQQIKALRRLSK